ncbi:hypothetical protein [Aureimonas populi]|uniref:Serine/threonine protein phosphatase n=1 Tax=Aureimonas populi TaxID=1701758 RepID=A0ABW5CJL5_9HYPH|nr:hypothetical protein [Aureimonas populi]
MTDPAPSSPVHDSHALLALARGGARRVERIELAGRAYWAKRPGTAEGGRWHAAQALLSRTLPLPILRPTVSRGGDAAAGGEAQRIEAFRRAGFHVPDIAARAPGLLILSDIGPNLGTVRQHLSAEAFGQVLRMAAETLGRAHAAGLVHGRPSLRDLTYDGRAIGFLDFEEDPRAVMPLASAQARDLWLFFCQLAAAGVRPEAQGAALVAYRPFLTPEVQAALRPLLTLVAGAGRLVMPLARPFAGRDLVAPIEASRLMRAGLSGAA